MKVKIKNANGLKKLIQIILIFAFLVILPKDIYSAELLQINDATSILVGDQNRSLNLSLYCVDIDKNDKEKATEILKNKFPRGTKVKIKPYGSNDSKLFAKIFRVDDDTEMTELLNTINTSEKKCMP
tara:strand:+ start:247 stop:627 length:381 start_codon:yes stop_codon:yes gene_type:complete